MLWVSKRTANFILSVSFEFIFYTFDELEKVLFVGFEEGSGWGVHWGCAGLIVECGKGVCVCGVVIWWFGCADLSCITPRPTTHCKKQRNYVWRVCFLFLHILFFNITHEMIVLHYTWTRLFVTGYSFPLVSSWSVFFKENVILLV